MAVRKRSWKTAKGETKQAWIAEYTDQHGKRHLETFERKKDADARLAQIKVEIRGGIHTPEHLSVSVNEAADLWLRDCDQRQTDKRLERTSVESYRQHMNLHVRPFIGRLKLTQLTVPVIRDFEDRLRAGRPVPGDNAKPRSANMIMRVRRSLGTMLADAQERGLVARNVVRDLRANRAPGKEHRASKRQKDRLQVGVDIPTREEIKAIVTAPASRWHPILLTAIFTGLRSSELRGLRWEDIDLDRGKLTVRQRADNRGAMGSPKSDTSRRTIPIPPLALNTIREWKPRCPKGKGDLVFPTNTGRPMNHSAIVQRGLQPVQVSAGVVTARIDKATGKPATDSDGKPIMDAKYPGLHSLRHFYASWCINSVADGGLGQPAKVVQERLGHSTIVLTMDRYGHLFPRGAGEAEELAAAELALLA